MRRRTFIKMCGAGALGLCGLGVGLGKERERRPNILFIFIDDMGYADPSCFGNPSMKTPNIDRLAAEGIRLTQFYTNSPICSPSRVAVMTGQYPIRWRIHSYLESRANNRKRQMANWLDPHAPMTARILKQAGYATAHLGKWHVGGGRDIGDAPLPQEYGFDESLVAFEGLGDRILFSKKGLSGPSAKLGRGKIEYLPKHQSTQRYVDRTLQFIRKNPVRPFYIELFPNDVHDAHQPPREAIKKWKAVTKNPFEQKFFAVLEELDRQIGRLLDGLDAEGLAERTLIVLTSDNGPTDWPSYYRKGFDPPGFTGRLYGRKWSLYEGGIRMPFIARWKGVIPAGAVDDETVMCGIDLAPTFCHFARVDVTESVRYDGEDMHDALLGKPRRRRRPIFWQYGDPYARLRPGNPDFVSPSLAVRDGNWKLLINPDGTQARLFNLAKDPGERSNLLDKNPRIAADLWKKVRDWAGSFGLATKDVSPAGPTTG
ncbi:MAG: sulfatase-like hydrolase/transferase [Sedimentisphaerales bacterium]